MLFDYTIIKPHHQCSHCGLVHVRDGQVCTKSLMLCQELSSDGCKVNQYLQRAALIGDALDTNPWSVANEPRGFIPLSDRHLEHACFIAHGVNRSVNLRPDMAVELDRLHKLYLAGNFDPHTRLRPFGGSSDVADPGDGPFLGLERTSRNPDTPLEHPHRTVGHPHRPDRWAPPPDRWSDRRGALNGPSRIPVRVCLATLFTLTGLLGVFSHVSEYYAAPPAPPALPDGSPECYGCILTIRHRTCIPVTGPTPGLKSAPRRALRAAAAAALRPSARSHSR